METCNMGLEAIRDKPLGCVLDGFPAGLNVLAIDDDRTCLAILERMLKRCLYQVTACQSATEALSLLRQDKNRFDIVVSDVHMPDMDGFELLKFVGVELDLPIVMMSSDDKQEILLKGIVHGACDYLIKPIRMDSIKVIWQHVLRKRRNGTKAVAATLPNSEEGKLVLKEPCSTPVYAVSKSIENVNCLKRRKDDEDTLSGKKRMVWTPELHQKFLSAVNHLGREKAVPMKILDLMKKMKVPGITRENIASHLQKHRLHLRQNNIAENPQQRFEFPRLNKKSVSDEFHSLELCHNNQFSSGSNQFVQPSFTRSMLSAPMAFSANSSIGMPLNYRTNLLPTCMTNFNNCLVVNSSANDFPLAVAGASGIDPFCGNAGSLSIPYSDASKYRSQETAAAPSAESLSAGDSRTEHDVRPLLEYDPSLHFQNFNQSVVLQEPFSAEDDASLAIDYESAWQLN